MRHSELHISLLAIFLLIGTTLFFSSCSNTKYLSDNESLLIKNSVKVIDKDEVKDKRPLRDEMVAIPSQKPNRKILGLARLKLACYNSIDVKKENRKFNNWFKYKLGEPPVIFDSSAMVQSSVLLKNYLFNKGYFQNKVSYAVETKNKKTKVLYTVEYSSPYMLWDVFFPQDSGRPFQIIRQNQNKSLLQFNTPFDISLLKAELERITSDLRNKGFYYINKESIHFDLDTSYIDRKVNIYIRLRPPADSGLHKIASINDVFVYPNYSLDVGGTGKFTDTFISRDLKYIYDVKKFSERTLSDFIFLRPGQLYSQERQLQSVKRLVNLGVYKFVNIDVKDVGDSIQPRLNMYIYLTPSKRQSYTFSFEQNYSNLGLLSSGLNFSYRNKNLTKRADLFQISLNGSVQFSLKKELRQTSLIFLADCGVEVSYQQNRFLMPVPIRRFSFNSNPKTRISVGYSFQRRFGLFSLHRSNLRFGYEWSDRNGSIKHNFNLIDLNVLIFSNRTDLFLQRLQDVPSLRFSYSDRIIPATNYVFNFSNQKDKNDKRFLNYTFTGEIAGNLVHGIASGIFKNSGKPKPYAILGTEYSQFVRFESDVRGYLVNNDRSAFVARLYAGIGIPYGNSKALPFIRQFFTGGGNSIRAFAPNTIGPGSYSDPAVIANPQTALQSGDIKLEFNAEYRFNIYKWFKGAFFLDAGNVWALRSDTSRSNAEFNAKRFYKEIALGTGFGIRADFDFFVLRFDLGAPLYDPRRTEGDRWVLDEYNFKKGGGLGRLLGYNLAIGYPF